MRNEFNKRFSLFVVVIDAYTHTHHTRIHSSVELLFLDHIFPFDSTWCLLVISLITLMCLFFFFFSLSLSLSTHCTILFFSGFCSVYIWFFVLYLFVSRQCVETYSCCAMFILFMMRVRISFIQSFGLTLKQTQIVNISWMVNQVPVSSFFFVCVIRFPTYMRPDVVYFFFFSFIFILKVKDFPKTILFAFWIWVFSL